MVRPMILVTGASGKTGKAVVAALAKAGAVVRALVRRPGQMDELVERGAREAKVVDLLQPPDLKRAFANVSAVYHICPNVHPDELEIGRNVLNAGREAVIRHFVLHSVLHPQAEAMPHHWNKLRVEEQLIQSGLEFTILQPTAYMQNLHAGWELIVESGVLRVPYPVSTRLSLVDLEDVASAAAVVLTEPGHLGATYELVGTPPLSQEEVAARLTGVLGREVHAHAESPEAWEERAHAAGLGAYQRATLMSMFRYYARHGLVGNSNTLRWILGRAPTTLVEFVDRIRVV